MQKILVLDEGYVSFVEGWGSDASIIEAARMSTSKGFNGWAQKRTQAMKSYWRISTTTSTQHRLKWVAW